MNRPIVMLVDDDADDTDLFRMAFRRHDAEAVLVVAADGDRALDYLHRERPRSGSARRLAVVLLDLKLRGLGGLDVLSRIRAVPETTHVPVVLMTSSVEDRDVLDGYRAGANGYVRKPDTFEALERAVAAIVSFWVSHNQGSAERARKE